MWYSHACAMQRQDSQKMQGSFLEGLNKEQRSAVLANGSVLVLAGAGAGKTKTITARIVRLIREGAKPNSILAITFTNKAAREMRERVLKALATENIGTAERSVPFVSTFHALCVHILRNHGMRLDIPRNFTILDRADSKTALKETMVELGIDVKQFEPSNILSRISREKGNLATPESLRAREGAGFGEALVARIWRRYQERLQKEHSLDFDDLLTATVSLLNHHTDIRTDLQTLWEYVHVDEYQDTNRVQYELVKLIVEPRKNLFVVGDIDQTIYTWRGAYIKNLVNFEKDYEGTSVIVLEENYRSTKTILDAANQIIKKNTVRYEKNLRANKPEGEPLGLYPAYDETDEASYIAHRARNLVKSGVPAGEIAVLYRANFQSRALEQAFLELKFPYQVLGTRFFDRKEVKDVVAFLRAAHNPESNADLKRIINTPPRGLGKLALLKILAGKEGELNASQKKKYADFKILMGKIRTAAETQKVSSAVKYAIEETGIAAMMSEKNEEERERLENIRELVTLAATYDAYPPQEGMERLLEDAALRSEQDELSEKNNAVRLMTVHAAKGLEFDAVFIAGLEQDLFPYARDAGGETPEESEEERRLFYVALTRARTRLFLSYANVRTIFGARTLTLPSEFLGDINDNLLKQEVHPLHILKTIDFD